MKVFPGQVVEIILFIMNKIYRDGSLTVLFFFVELNHCTAAAHDICAENAQNQLIYAGSRS